MKHKALILTSVVLVVLLVSFAPLLASDDAAASAKAQSASGTVTALADDSFSLMVDTGARLTFETTADTQVDGTLAAGSTVRVAYRVEEGRNIALRVVVEG